MLIEKLILEKVENIRKCTRGNDTKREKILKSWNIARNLKASRETESVWSEASSFL